MKREKTDTYEEYSLKRAEENKLDKLRSRGCFIWQPQLQGQRVGVFKDVDSFILNDLFSNDTIKADIAEKARVAEEAREKKVADQLAVLEEIETKRLEKEEIKETP